MQVQLALLHIQVWEAPLAGTQVQKSPLARSQVQKSPLARTQVQSMLACRRLVDVFAGAFVVLPVIVAFFRLHSVV